MNTKLSTNRKLIRMFANNLSIFVILAIAFPAVWSVSAQESNPHFTIFPEWEWFDGLDWPDGATVAITVKDKSVCNTTSSASSGGFFNGGFPEGCDIVAGDEITFTFGGTIRMHTVQNLSVTEVNADADTVAGTADSGVTVYVWPHGYGEYEVQPITGSDYIWLADFSEFGDVLEPGMDGRAEVRDDYGNATAVDWYIPNPHFYVFPEWDYIIGWEWPAGNFVTAEVYHSGDEEPACIATVKVAHPEWGNDVYVAEFFPVETCDIQANDHVVLTDGHLSRDHFVFPLQVTMLDQESNTIGGFAEPGIEVQTWIHEEDGTFHTVMPNDDGDWVIDFTPFDLAVNMGGRTEQYDDDGDATSVDWYIPNPHFTVFPEWEWFDGNDWPDGATVTITVEGKPECETAKESWGSFFNGSFGEGCDLEIGDMVTFTDGETTQIHTVQNLSVTKANHDDDTIKGTADPGAEVFVWPHATGEQQMAIAKTQGMAKGKWNVDFSGFYDLAPGECGRSEIRDEFANSTAVDWCISNPRIVASESGDWFWTTDFKPGDLDISIYDSPDDGANLLWSGQQVADEWGFAFVGSDIHGQDLVPGNFLVISDGDSQKSLVLQPIFVTMFDTEYEFMAGFAPPGSEVWAAAGPEDWQEHIMVMADPVSGEWFADFAEIGFDITEDMRPWSYAHIYDEDGDANEGSTPPPGATLIVITNQPDWVNSGVTVSAGQSITIQAVGLMNPCSDTYPNGADYCIFYTPLGAEGVVPDENEFGIFPGPGLPFMALLGRIDDGEPFYVGTGSTFTQEQAGTLWFTPNDNLRTDNQGAYSVLVWLVP